MNRDQMWMIGSVVMSGVILAGGYFLGIAPLFAEAALTDSDRVAAETQATANKATLSTLKEKYANIDMLKADLAQARTLIPAESDMSEFIGGLDLIAQQTGSQVLDVTLAEALPYAPPVVVAPVAPVDDAAESEDADAAAPIEPDPVVSSTPLVPNADLVTSSNTAIIPVTISVSGSFDQNTAFIGALQSGNRIFLVTRLTTTLDTNDAVFSTKIEGYVYVVLTADAAAAIAPAPSAATAAAG